MTCPGRPRSGGPSATGRLGAAGMNDASGASASARRTGRRSRWSARSCTCGGSIGWARSRSLTGSGCRPPRCTRCWCGAGSTGSATSTGPPVNRSAATSTTTPGRAAPRRRQEARQRPRRRRLAVRRPAPRWSQPEPSHRHRGTASTTNPKIGHRASCTPSSTITPASPTPRSTTTRPPPPRPRVLRRAVAWFAARGVTAHRVLSDNGSAYRSNLWRDTCLELGITIEAHPALPAPDQRQDRTLPPHPGRRLGVQAALHLRVSPQRELCQRWLHEYNHHRPHTAIGKVSAHHPLDQPPGQYS